MKTKTQEKIQLAKRYYGMVYVNECFGSRDLLAYMKLRDELFGMGYYADERNKEVVFKEVVFKKIEC